jgi:hypothetical protein
MIPLLALLYPVRPLMIWRSKNCFDEVLITLEEMLKEAKIFT